MFLDPLAAAKHHFETLLVILNKCSIKIIFSVPFSAEDLQNTDGTSDEGAFPWKDSSPTWPGAEPAVGTLIRSGPEGARGVLGFGRFLLSAFILSFFVFIYALSLFIQIAYGNFRSGPSEGGGASESLHTVGYKKTKQNNEN